MNDLKALHLIHSTIKYYQIFGATPEIRDELLTVARRAIGTNPQTLSAAASQIEIMIAKLKADPVSWQSFPRRWKISPSALFSCAKIRTVELVWFNSKKVMHDLRTVWCSERLLSSIYRARLTLALTPNMSSRAFFTDPIEILLRWTRICLISPHGASRIKKSKSIAFKNRATRERESGWYSGPADGAWPANSLGHAYRGRTVARWSAAGKVRIGTAETDLVSLLYELFRGYMSALGHSPRKNRLRVFLRTPSLVLPIPNKRNPTTAMNVTRATSSKTSSGWSPPCEIPKYVSIKSMCIVALKSASA
jgi:hypothetical protein